MFYLRYFPKYFGMKSGHALVWLPILWEAEKVKRCKDEARLAMSSRKLNLGDGFTEAHMLFCLLLHIFQVSTVKSSFKKIPDGATRGRQPASPETTTREGVHSSTAAHWRPGNHGTRENLRAVVTPPRLQTPQPPRASAAVLVTQLRFKPTGIRIWAKPRAKERRPGLGHQAWPRG